MPLHHLFVDVGAPAWLGRHDQLAVLYARRLGNEIVLPGHVIDVDLHDAEVRYRCAEVGAHQSGHVTIEVVRRAVDLVGLAIAAIFIASRMPFQGTSTMLTSMA